MSVHRVMGIETEYGISVPGRPTLNAMLSSTQVVAAYGSRAMRPARMNPTWDYAVESPLRDARGFDMTRAEADPSQLTDEDFGMANVILTNGARLYVDHAHPEYSSPEVTNPRDAVLWDRAGVVVMQEAMRLAGQSWEYGDVLLYKNNTDNKGASYGCHENFLMAREVAFADIVRHLVPFFVTRQIYAGAGRLGVGQDGRISQFQISQRADFFEVEVGLETTLKRPIINTRDEPHADPEKYRRLHVIVGDANMSDTATFLKMGATSIVLSMIEAGTLDRLRLYPRDPVKAMHAVSHDVTLSHRIALEDGRTMTAIDIQYAYLEAAIGHCERTGATDDATREILQLWTSVLDGLRSDPASQATILDWVAKLEVMRGFIRRDGLDWSSPRLQLIDLQYADLRPERGLAWKLESRGRLVRMFSDDAVVHATENPPTDTRAYFRGTCMNQFPGEIAAASWDSVVFDLPDSDTLIRVPTLDPLRGTREHVGRILESSSEAAALVQALSDHTG